MYCETVNDCFEQINGYCGSGNAMGYPLLINIDNFDVFQAILARLEADKAKECIYMSNIIQKNGLPDVAKASTMVLNTNACVLIGFSQALMLQGEHELEAELDNMLHLPVSSPAIILLSHCKAYLDAFMQRDMRTKNRIILVAGEKTPLPSIKLCDDENLCVGFKPLNGIKGFLSYMEHAHISDILKHPVLTVLTNFKPTLFANSLFSVSYSDGAYNALCQKFSDIMIAEMSFGSEAQWMWLNEQMLDSSSFSSYICMAFGSTANLISHLNEVSESEEANRFWLLWLAMKVFGVQNNRYLSTVLANTDSSNDFAMHVYFDLLQMDSDAPDFWQCYNERKRIVLELPENLNLLNSYCNAVGVKGKDAICYLTCNSEREEFELFKTLSVYDYDENALLDAMKRTFPSVYTYLTLFRFDKLNTKLSDGEEAFWDTLTEYYHDYKLQKVLNRIEEPFVAQISAFAKSRQYNKLTSRSSVVNGISKDKAIVFFFDALGVEYLSFIQAKCEEFGMVSEIAVTRCELPSITSENKEFEKTCPVVKKVPDLDEIKHHSQIYDYSVCPLPIHLTRELDIIDRELRRINAQLIQGLIDKAVIVSDHGASRLAVLYGQDSCSNITLDEKAGHSGRCCKVSQDPGIEDAAYENGYSILANYERFKGGRKANLEVHGGASLEEVMVPVISLTRMPDNVMYCFVDPVIKFKINQDAAITLYCNAPMQAPKMLVNGLLYEGRFIKDKKHAQFIMPELKRTNEYIGELYEGDSNLGISLWFRIERGTKEKSLF